MSNEMQRLAKRLTKEGAVFSPKEERHQWLKAVHALFKDLEDWVSPLIQTRVASFSGRVEQNTGGSKDGRIHFGRPSFTLQFSQRKFVFRPSKIGLIDLQIHGHEHPKPYQILLSPTGSWELREAGGEIKIPFTQDSLASFLSRWV